MSQFRIGDRIGDRNSGSGVRDCARLLRAAFRSAGRPLPLPFSPYGQLGHVAAQ